MFKNENRVRNLINKQRKGKVRSCTQEELGRMKKGFADLLRERGSRENELPNEGGGILN